MKTPVFLACPLLLATLAAAQVPPLVPFARTLDLVVVDGTADSVVRLADRNQDGDLHDPGELSVLYSSAAGTIPLGTPTCCAVAGDGTVYVADSSNDQVLALLDRNGDGDALDPGEHRVFFDSATNASGVVMASALGITVAGDGALFLAVANAGSVGSDMILRLFDGNGDGDAQGAGEATVYCAIPNSGGSVGDSIPTKVVVGWNGRLYYSDVGSTGMVTKGVWELRDLNNDGDCNDPGELNLLWTPPAPANAFYWGLAIDASGRLWVSDHGNNTIWTGFDQNGDGAIAPSEEQLFYQTGGSTWWELALRDDGTLVVCDDQTPDRIVGLRDMNQDGDALDPGESFDLWSDLISPDDIQRPRAAAFVRAPLLRATPSTVRIGGAVTLEATTSRAGDLAAMLLAASTVRFPVPPFGVLELDPGTLVPLGTVVADPRAQARLSFTVPADARLVGSWPFQAVGADLSRQYLSDLALLAVTQ